MGQKVHPIGIRLGFIKSWRSVWYANVKDYANKLNKDIELRKFVQKKVNECFG
jgi:small subunit ribosomal protein S3